MNKLEQKKVKDDFMNSLKQQKLKWKIDYLMYKLLEQGKGHDLLSFKKTLKQIVILYNRLNNNE